MVCDKIGSVLPKVLQFEPLNDLWGSTEPITDAATIGCTLKLMVTPQELPSEAPPGPTLAGGVLVGDVTRRPTSPDNGFQVHPLRGLRCVVHSRSYVTPRLQGFTKFCSHFKRTTVSETIVSVPEVIVTWQCDP